MGCNPTGTFVKTAFNPSSSIIPGHGAPDLPPMRPFEVITPEADRLGAGLPPKRHVAVLIRRATVRFPDDPRVATAEISRFGMGRNDFQERAHGVRIYLGLRPEMIIRSCPRNSTRCALMASQTTPRARRLPQVSYTAMTNSPNVSAFFAGLAFITRT